MSKDASIAVLILLVLLTIGSKNQILLSALSTRPKLIQTGHELLLIHLSSSASSTLIRVNWKSQPMIHEAPGLKDEFTTLTGLRWCCWTQKN
jgi:hypothetical protein